MKGFRKALSIAGALAASLIVWGAGVPAAQASKPSPSSGSGKQALASAAPSGPVVELRTEEVEYQRAIARVERASDGGRKPLTASSFQRLNWLGRVAAINHTCSVQNERACRDLLKMALTDRALVVRDHALKVMLASEGFTREEKRQAAKNVIDDDRNYRRGISLWIVDRAKKYAEQQ